MAFDLARFWRVSPHETLRLPLAELAVWEAQALRIGDELSVEEL